MIHIRPIQPGEGLAVKKIIAEIANRIYHFTPSDEEAFAQLVAHGELKDLDDPQGHYMDRNGLFLVAVDDSAADGARIVGSGGIRPMPAPLTREICELKRMWLLEEYQGQGIGHRVLQGLLDFALAAGYRMVRLTTGDKQDRAVRFYERHGFQRVPPWKNEDADGICMERELKDEG